MMHWDPAFLFVFAICTGAATGSLARHRGRSFFLWFVFGAVAWFVAIPWLLFTRSPRNDGVASSGTVLPTLLAAACAMAVFVANLAWAPATLPNCDYYSNISALNKAAAGSSGRQAGSPEIVTIVNIKEVSRSNSDVRCSATARFGDSTEAAIDYRFFIEDRRLLAEIHQQ
jgi:hypothetical protein